MRPLFFSIIVPTFNRHESLISCVRAISQLDYPRDHFEVVVVDDGSRIPVGPLERHVPHGVRITVVRQLNAGPASARNFGAQHARGDFLAFTDDDCTPGPMWLQALARTFHKTPESLVGGRIVNGLGDNMYSTVSQLIVDEAYAYFLGRNSDLKFFASNNLAVPTKLFHENGGFNTSFRTSEDRDFCDRFLRRGNPLVYAPEAVVHHRHPLTLKTFWRQHFSYGRGAYLFHRARIQRTGTFIRPDLRFYARACRRVLLTSASGQAIYKTGLLGMWQAANLAGFLYEGCWKHIRRFTRSQGVKVSCNKKGSAGSSEKTKP